MYDTYEVSDTDNMEGLEVLSTDEDKTATNNTNRKGITGSPKKTRSTSKYHVRNNKKLQTRLIKKQA